MKLRRRPARHSGAGNDDRRAVIDIGSNTVRLVIYGGPPRVPTVLWNEKVSARLGRDLARTGAIPAAAMDEALAALARYSQLVADLGITEVEAVATAAPRDASNGPEFLSSVAAVGLDVRLLSGTEEAQASASGAIGAFPGAAGLVADLGGGSLELVPVADGCCGSGVSLPLGTLRLPSLRATGAFGSTVKSMLAGSGIDRTASGTMYMIGGTWRALAIHAMRAMDHPLTDPHGFDLPAAEAKELAKSLQRADPGQLAQVRGVSAMRAEKLPDAAALLRVILDRLQPDRLVFSSWGLREGLHYSRLDRAVRALDPLLAGVEAFAPARGPHFADAGLLSDWTAQAVVETNAVDPRIRRAAAALVPALQGVEPNLRVAYAAEWALDKRWIGIEPAERGLLAAILLGSVGRTTLPERVARLAPAPCVTAAIAAGLALRLAYRLGGGSRAVLQSSRLVTSEGILGLSLSPEHAAMASPAVAKDLAALASVLKFEPELSIDS